MADQEAVWQTDATQSITSLANRNGWIDLRQRAFAWAHASVTGQVLQLICGDGAAQLVDHYARGSEYVARYGNFPAGESSTEIRWRYEQPRDSHWQIDWLASMQTDQPLTSINCTCRSQWNRQRIYVRTAQRGWFGVDEQVYSADRSDRAQAFAVLTGEDRVYAEFIWPSDFDGIYVSRGMEYMVAAWRMAAFQLERGVIRRLRVRAVFADEGFDPARLDAWYDEFNASPVPLTA